jgi:hypothetical protein
MIEDHEVRAYAALYYNTPARKAQDTGQLYLCVMNSLSAEAQNKVSLREKGYTFTDGDTTCVSGTCLLKIVIADASIGTNATVSSTMQSSKPKSTVVRLVPCLGDSK